MTKTNNQSTQSSSSTQKYELESKFIEKQLKECNIKELLHNFDDASNIIAFRLSNNEIIDLHQYANLKLPNSSDSQKIDISKIQYTNMNPIYLNTEDALHILRHDAAHVLAQAIQELYSNAEFGVGPSTETGFFYDVKVSDSISSDNLEEIEAKMREIVNQKQRIFREVWTYDQAYKFFKNQKYKLEILNGLQKSEDIQVYRQGNFTDLCRGPHSLHTGNMGYNFKLTGVSGVYWKGDKNNDQMQRIYGTLWLTKEDLNQHLTFLKEANEWDHRRLGQNMELIHFDSQISSGMTFWLPQGKLLFNLISTYLSKLKAEHEYQEVSTPFLYNKVLWEKSGHWKLFQDNMISFDFDEVPCVLKPMNCPAHIEIFRKMVKSYRDLPYKLAEFGFCHRYEPSGSLHGMMRTRGFTQDDAHIFCTANQVEEMILSCCNLLKQVYTNFGFENIKVFLSTRPDEFAGDISLWNQAELALEKAAKLANLNYTIQPKEGAFYGPKLEFSICDRRKRTWQCGTIQLDFVLPKSLDIGYVTEEGEIERPVMIHYAILGSLERFIAILIEHTKGLLPLWIAPTQIVIATVSDEAKNFAEKVYSNLIKKEVRAKFDFTSKTLSSKIKLYTEKRISLLGVIGKKEMQSNMISIRKISGKMYTLTLDELVNHFKNLGTKSELPLE